MQTIKKFIRENSLILIFALAFIGTLSSLYFSEIVKLLPCSLCWWQRIWLYPITIISFVAILRHEKNVLYYILPFAVLGAITGFGQYLLQMGVIPEIYAPCVNGVSCAKIDFILLNFITIPLLSAICFTTIAIICLVGFSSRSSK